MMDASGSWSGHDPTLTSPPQDEFQQFLDLGMNNLGDSLNFDFPEYNAQQNGHIMQQDGSEPMDTSMDGEIRLIEQKNVMMQRQISMASSHSPMTNPPVNQGHSSSGSLSELDAQIQYLQHQRQQQHQRQLEEQQQHQQQQSYYAARNRMIPPTPNSIEMHSANDQFYPQQDSQQQAMYESYQTRLKEQELAFTPLVSPAVTPLDAHFNIPEYTVPGAYFSPLSSPALHAQIEHRSVYDTRHLDTSSTTSPIDMDTDSLAVSANTSASTRKATKKASSKPRTPRSVRQSPIVKPQRRRTGGSIVIPAETLSELAEPAIHMRSHPDAPRSNVSTEGSEKDSISPEHLSDMAPPPVPHSGSATRSPYLVGQNGQSHVQHMMLGNGVSPATPASLMRLPKGHENSASPSFAGHGEMYDDHLMEGFALPEAANPQLSRSQKGTDTDGQATPTLKSTPSQTPTFGVLPSPVFVRPQISTSTTSSPQLKSMNSGSVTPTYRKTPQLAVRPNVKKRGSVASIHVSPALRPRISPSIKPLIRGGISVSDDTASLLLTSKSNYQNILEGTHLPGVSYPTELSTNLTSKRTSHKIAEQGRRNRINTALQEIARLLPKGGKDSGSGSGEIEGGEKETNVDEDGKSVPVAQSANSKASTVELAIEYIKQLKQEVEDANRRADEAEKKLDTELKVT